MCTLCVCERVRCARVYVCTTHIHIRESIHENTNIHHRSPHTRTHKNLLLLERRDSLLCVVESAVQVPRKLVDFSLVFLLHGGLPLCECEIASENMSMHTSTNTCSHKINAFTHELTYRVIHSFTHLLTYFAV